MAGNEPRNPCELQIYDWLTALIIMKMRDEPSGRRSELHIFLGPRTAILSREPQGETAFEPPAVRLELDLSLAVVENLED
jgi:hypothetical protein